MRNKVLKAFVVLGLALGTLAGMSAPAHAEFNIGTGLRWNPLRYTKPLTYSAGPLTDGGTTGAWEPRGVGGCAAMGACVPAASFQTTSLDTYIAFYVIEQVGITLSIDLGWWQAQNETSPAMAADNTTRNSSYFQFGFGIGGKFYLNRPAATRVSPYIWIDFFKYFASLSQNRPAPPGPDLPSLTQGLLSPIGANLAFGAEYFFTTSFSIGAEVLGLRVAHAEGSMGVGGGQIYSERNTSLTAYTGISLNYRFLASASVKTYEDEEDRRNPRAPRRPKPRPRPEYEDEGAGGSRESVD